MVGSIWVSAAQVGACSGSPRSGYRRGQYGGVFAFVDGAHRPVEVLESVGVGYQHRQSRVLSDPSSNDRCTVLYRFFDLVNQLG